MSLTVHVYCNGVEQGCIEVAYGESNESLSRKITANFGINEFMFEEGFNIDTLCEDDDIYVEYDKEIEAKRVVKCYTDNNDIIDICNDVAFIQALIDAKMVDMKSRMGRTAISCASEKGYSDVVQMLISAKADISLRDLHIDTAIHIASRNGHVDIVKMLIGAGADINSKNIRGDTPIYTASYKGYNNIVQTLIVAGANVNIYNEYHMTPLHMAAKYNYVEIVRTLLLADAKTDISNFEDDTPLSIAKWYKHDDIVTILKQHPRHVMIRRRLLHI